MRHSTGYAHALPLDDRLFQEPFYLTHAGWERVLPRQPYPRPGHPSYYGFTWMDGRVLGEFCLALVIRGEGELETEQGTRNLQPGQAFLYQPGEWHRHRPKPAIGWITMWINFNGSLPHQWMRDGAFHLDRNLVQVKNRRLFQSQFRHLIESVHAASTRNSVLFSWQAIGLLSHFLQEPPLTNHPKAPPSEDKLVDSAMDYIWSHSHNQIGVTDVVQHTGGIRRTLERRFKTATGKTLLQEIQRCRLSRAELLVRQTNVPLKYVVGRAGFTSYQQQRQAFHRHLGTSPETFRQRNRMK